MSLTLVIGNKNYSSWSFRPWIAMKVAGIPFTKELIPFETPDLKQRIGARFNGKVPILLDGDLQIWESLAIVEYLAEAFPAAGLWPKTKRRGRMRARSRTKCTPASCRCAVICR